MFGLSIPIAKSCLDATERIECDSVLLQYGLDTPLANTCMDATGATPMVHGSAFHWNIFMYTQVGTTRDWMPRVDLDWIGFDVM